MKPPILSLKLNKPSRASLAYYSGLGVMAATGLIEWPLAAVVAAGNLIAENSRSAAVTGAAEGAESGAG